MINQFCLVLDYISYYFERITDAEKQEGISNDYTEKFTHIFINDKNMKKNRENKDEVRGGEEERVVWNK